MVSIPTDSLVDARNLFVRIRESSSFQQYLYDRRQLVLPAMVVFLMFIVASTAATVVVLSGPGAGLVLFTFLLAPFLFLGSLAVAAYLFLSWLEYRALQHTLHHSVKGGPLPRVPWAWVAVFLIVPALCLVLAWWKLALPLLLLVAGTPFIYMRLDKN